MRSLFFTLLLLLPTVALAVPTAQPAMLPLGTGADANAVGTARMVGAMLEYTRWPTARPVVRLCLAGNARHAGRLADISLSNGAQLQLSSLNGPAAARSEGCDALYIGRLDAAPMQGLIAGTRGQPVLTITEDDPDCRSGAIFCLLYAPQTLSFQLNIDAVSRSAVRIDPRVLRLSKGGY
ncbi:YfiR family protein [Sphingobium sp. WCS2017Hpa-17]|uniref:YfiR family protein n=1 Tax=Sphingobium sp. WCS2017Hpa-17 TaxID=3073638 RepID=UPI0028890CA7|nr:YfiR family protein [Sphingobium sp. WCS2017Hpa-17]